MLDFSPMAIGLEFCPPPPIINKKGVFYEEIQGFPDLPQNRDEDPQKQSPGRPLAKRRNQEMKYIYATYNRRVGFYNDPHMTEIEPNQYTTSCCRGITLDKEEGRKHHMDECELYFLGIFDEESCVYNLKDKPVFLADFGKIYAN